MKNKENKSASDQKKLESLEMIKKEFKETFAVEGKEEKKNQKLIEEEKKLKTNKKTDKEINLKNKKPKKM